VAFALEFEANGSDRHAMKAQAVTLLALALSICSGEEKVCKRDPAPCSPCDTGEPEDTSPPEDTAPPEDTSPPEPTCIELDFDTDAGGAPILAGQDVAEVYAGWGVHVATWDAGRVYAGLGIAFDSSNPPGTDYDLGTPNEMYGGPGVGAAGASNDIALHNLLIRAESTTDADGDGLVDIPDDHVYGATFVITLDAPWCLTSIDFVDIDENPASLVLLAADGGELITIATSLHGDNSRETIEPGTCEVSSLEISLAGSGAVDRITLCD
jgi:hypothetical protein